MVDIICRHRTYLNTAEVGVSQFAERHESHAQDKAVVEEPRSALSRPLTATTAGLRERQVTRPTAKFHTSFSPICGTCPLRTCPRRFTPTPTILSAKLDDVGRAAERA